MRGGGAAAASRGAGSGAGVGSGGGGPGAGAGATVEETHVSVSGFNGDEVREYMRKGTWRFQFIYRSFFGDVEKEDARAVFV